MNKVREMMNGTALVTDKAVAKKANGGWLIQVHGSKPFASVKDGSPTHAKLVKTKGQARKVLENL